MRSLLVASILLLLCLDKARDSDAADGCSRSGDACSLNYLVVLGSVREGRIGDRVAKFAKRYLEEKQHKVEVLDPEVIELPLLKKALHFYEDQSAVPKILQELNAKVLAADALIIITAEYNRQMPPALINLLDHLPPATYSYRVSGIVSYSMGPYGGTIAANNARSYLTELGCLPVSAMFAIPEAHKAFDEEGIPLNPRMISGIERLVNQTNWWATAAKKQRSLWGVPPPDQY